MPRNPQAPRASEVHWLSAEEKETALVLLPDGESFSNYVRRKLFKLSSLAHGGARHRPAPSGVASTGQRGGREAKAGPRPSPFRPRR